MLGLIICIVVIIEGIIILKKGSERIEIMWFSIGGILIGYHLLALLGASKVGRPAPSLFDIRSSYDLFGYIGYNLALFIGIVFVILGIKRIRTSKAVEREQKEELTGTQAECVLRERLASEEEKEYRFKCEMCDCGCDKITYSIIKDGMGTRYRNLCDSCIKKHNATPHNDIKKGE